MSHLLQVRRLSVHFNTCKGPIHALNQVDFCLEKGEITALVRESGCGKSVTGQAIMGLLGREALINSGEILFEGDNLLAKTEKEMQGIRGKKIGMIFQDPMTALNPTVKIGNQVMEGLRKHERLTKEEAYQRAIEWLQQVGINEPASRFQQYPHELSGGMRQRILIAIALACQPQLLIADEPTTALDVTIQAQILDLLRDIQRQKGHTLLLITHDLGVVANLCNRVLVMHGGKVVEEGPVDQIFFNPFHPYTQELLRKCAKIT